MSDLFGGTPQVPNYYYQQPDQSSLLTSPTPAVPNSPEAKAAADRIQRQNQARLGQQATILTSPTGLTPTRYTGTSILGS